jgi:hypothetical protein
MSVVLYAHDRGGTTGPRRGPRVLVGLVLGIALAVGAVALLKAGVAWADSSCPNEAFRNGPSSHLPDCRAYELVSPADKNGGNVDGGVNAEGVPAPQQAAADGESVTYASQAAFTSADPLAALAANQYYSRRGQNGWTTDAITPPQIYPGGELDKSFFSTVYSLYQGFSENLDLGFLQSNEPPLSPLQPRDFYSPYLRNQVTGSYELLSTTTPPVSPPGETNHNGFRTIYGGMSTDEQHVVMEANDAMAPKAIPGESNLYEDNSGRLETINVLPNGETVGESSLGGFNEEHMQGQENYHDFYREISSDGLRVFWTGPERNIYLHELTPEGPHTLQVGTGKFWGASSDGSIVYYGAAEHGTEIEELPGGDLYRNDLSTGRTLDIAPGAELAGVLGISEDGSYIYFAGKGALTPGAVAGKSNLYLWHSDGVEGGTLTLVSVLGTQTIEGKDWYQGLPERTSRVSPNGRYVAFETVEPLNGYDNKPQNPDEACPPYGGGRALADLNYSGRCSEVYEYDATTGSLRCVSCNPTGALPIGDSVVPGGYNFLQAGFGWQSNTLQQRYLDDSGRLFFNSYEALVPQATGNSENVYEFDPAGVGSCASAAGCIYLISNGVNSAKAVFLDASASGDDVFFLTYDQLVPQDGDELADVYDARVGGGFSLLESPVCGGEACKPPNTPAPAIYGAPASAAFVGSGNPISAPAAVVNKPKAKSKQTKAARKKQRKRRVRVKHRKSIKKGEG